MTGRLARDDPLLNHDGLGRDANFAPISPTHHNGAIGFDHGEHVVVFTGDCNRRFLCCQRHAACFLHTGWLQFLFLRYQREGSPWPHRESAARFASQSLLPRLAACL